MPDTVETIIYKALRNRLNGLTFDPPLPIAWPNFAFDPPPTTYLKVDILWNRNVNRGIAANSATERRGIYQVTVVAPANTGIVAPTNIAGVVAAHFTRGTPLNRDGIKVKIEGEPSLGPPLPSGDRIRLPISIGFYAFT
jgi:hypothetical protein